MEKIKFIKMNGAGNDFVIFDAREQEVELTKEQIRKICDRKNIGCDQLIILRTPDVMLSSACPESIEGSKHDVGAPKPESCFDPSIDSGQAELSMTSVDAIMEIYNSDGSVSGACGNATRCVASLIDKDEVKIKTAAGILECKKNGNLISVNMGIPKFTFDKIQLEDFEFSCLDIGNPHAVTFISNQIDDKKFFDAGPKVENNPIFPNKTNVEFAQIISDDLINVRVWERGAGETMACGSGACAVGILAIKKGLIKNNKVTTRFKGGDLIIEWNGEKSPVIMTGGYEKEYEGFLDEKFL